MMRQVCSLPAQFINKISPQCKMQNNTKLNLEENTQKIDLPFRNQRNVLSFVLLLLLLVLVMLHIAASQGGEVAGPETNSVEGFDLFLIFGCSLCAKRTQPYSPQRAKITKILHKDTLSDCFAFFIIIFSVFSIFISNVIRVLQYGREVVRVVLALFG